MIPNFFTGLRHHLSFWNLYMHAWLLKRLTGWRSESSVYTGLIPSMESVVCQNQCPNTNL